MSAISSQADAKEEKRRLFNAALQLILHLAASKPVLIEIEDVHWSDAASQDLLRHLVRRISAYPLLLIATYRSDEILPALPAFLAKMDRERATASTHLKRACPSCEMVSTRRIGLNTQVDHEPLM